MQYFTQSLIFFLYSYFISLRLIKNTHSALIMSTNQIIDGSDTKEQESLVTNNNVNTNDNDTDKIPLIQDLFDDKLFDIILIFLSFADFVFDWLVYQWKTNIIIASVVLLLSLIIYYKRRKEQLDNRLKYMIGKHVGFILESIAKLPITIWKLCVLIIHQNNNTIIIISLFISVFSISSKVIIFMPSINNTIYRFNSLSILADFFGIFCIIIWLFYDNNYNWSSISSLFYSMNIIGKWYLLETCVILSVLILPYTVAVIPVSIHQCFMRPRYDNQRYLEACTYCVIIPCILLVLVYTAAYAVLSIVITAAFLMSNHICLPLFLDLTIELKIPNASLVDYYFYKKLDTFLEEYIDENDRLLRVISASRVGRGKFVGTCELYWYIIVYEKTMTVDTIPYKSMNFDNICDEMEIKFGMPYVKNIFYYVLMKIVIIYNDKFSDMVNFYNNRYQYRCRKLVKLAQYFISTLLYILISFFILSKLFKLLLPFIILFHLLITNTWNNKYMFQYIMLICYSCIIIGLLIVINPALKLYHSRFYMNMDSGLKCISTMIKADAYWNNMYQYYEYCLNMPIRNQIINDTFGKDIGKIIREYLPFFGEITP